MSDDSLIGTVLAERYRVDRLIGEGAMGRVYLAEHILMRKRVALKVLHPELMTVPEVIQRFEREARAAAHIEHVHVAGATDFGKLENGRIYLILEFVEGNSLTKAIEAGPMDIGRVLTIGAQVASALEAAHSRGIVHRDLKPDNLLLVSNESNDDFIKVLDFGIAKVPTEPNEKGQAITQVGMVYGTPEYMAPEQALGQEVDARADLYALGVMMFEMLTGRRPYVGPTVALLGQQLATPLPKMGHVAKVRVPPAVEQLVVELLEPDAKKRTSSATSAREQMDALSEALAAGKLSGAGRGRGSSLLSVSLEEVTSRIEMVAQNIPEPVARVVKSRTSRALLVSLTFGALGVVAAIFIVGAMVTSPETETQAFEDRAPPPRVFEVPEDSHQIKTQLLEARKGGIAGLKKLAEKYPGEAEVRAELALSFAKGKRYVEAVDSARIALALDPKLNENPKIAGALFRAAQSEKASADALRLLQGAMGEAGVGIIYDLAHTKGLNWGIRNRALGLLSQEGVRGAASPALLLVLDLTNAKTCEDSLPLVKRAILLGDTRALPLLRKLEKTQGCGRRKKSDCYTCLRDGKDLENALMSIDKRAATSTLDTDLPGPKAR